MKNLMIYVHPSKGFTEEYAGLVKVQIDDAVRRWKKENIILAVNFPYSYNGIDSIVVPDDLFCGHHKKASKINVIYYLIDNKMIDGLCWFHDFDAYQLQELPEDLLGDKDAAFTDYGFNPSWNTGSFFFTPKARDVFELIRTTMDRRHANEEQTLNLLTSKNTANINQRYKKLNNTYNLGQKWESDFAYKKADKPIRVLHFHPRMPDVYERVKPLIPDYLMEIFKKHGY
ncbi:hypothetical protein A2617_00285 [Candidatus Daviesbacteria bacterium RIFOXYD1_FULL_41_10]|uniref:Nucleotide-diphospho-sugar transferase domain-containing protein n=2 Tax=Candidatus Daviesiibacteriota TaxID=1752718 RepID=A0A1F5MZR3_9BACT|nr:MAG: hypothetical protein UU67_C0015G0008 [Candidatus Daviesbacteria bacterium GW2011_GWB1_41_5]OGE70855.1 MAG: hypothetical protein A2617_00285 [Candidatus Daviesbacteria bacterium RIFOXYD1_FULL_41_10]